MFQESAVGTKRKPEGPPQDVRATLGAAVKRRRAEAEALIHCSVAVSTGASTPANTPRTPASAKASNGAVAANTETSATELCCDTESILLAGRFFDEAGCGFIEAQDLEDIFHNCYPYSSRRCVLIYLV